MGKWYAHSALDDASQRKIRDAAMEAVAATSFAHDKCQVAATTQHKHRGEIQFVNTVEADQSHKIVAPSCRLLEEFKIEKTLCDSEEFHI